MSVITQKDDNTDTFLAKEDAIRSVDGCTTQQRRAQEVDGDEMMTLD